MIDNLFLLIGTYTKEKSKGIYVYRFDEETGDSEYNSLIETENPSYLTVATNKNRVYAVSENEDDPGYAVAFSFDNAKGELTFLNRQRTMGNTPCNIVTDKDNKYLITSNYGGGSLTIFDTLENGEVGMLKLLLEFDGKGVVPERQDASHIHCAIFSPDEKFLFLTDLGTDHIFRFEVNKTGTDELIVQESFTAFKVTDGSGPRHIVFHPSGKYLYLINEISGTLTGFLYEDGNLTELQTVSANIYGSEKSGDIVITPDGNFLYASNRNTGDGITVFSIDRLNGELTQVEYKFTGINPRNLKITGNGKFLLSANRGSNEIEIFSINPNSGILENTGKTIEVDSPVCLEFI